MLKKNEVEIPTHLSVKIELYKRRCFDFITVKGDKKHEKQEQALQILTDNKHVELLYGGGAGGAKSWTGASWLMFNCMAYPNTKWFCGRESLKRITQSTLITFYKVASTYGIVRDVHFKYNGQLNYIEFYNGSRIDMLDLRYIPSDPLYERYGSTEYTGGWIEEGGEVNFGAYDTLKTRIGRHLNDNYGLLRKLLITCNPKKNWMYQIFYKPYKNNELPEHMQYLTCLVHENPFIESGYIDALKSASDKVKKERLLKGNWDYDDNPQALCSYDDIIAIFGNKLAKKNGKNYLTADIARFGSDYARIAVWDGYNVIDVKSFAISKTTDIQNYIIRCQKKYRIPNHKCIADEDGVGGGVVDSLGIQGFVNNSRPLNNENYRNLQAQCGYKLAEHINDSDIGIEPNLVSQDDIEQIATELGQLQTWNPDSDGRLEIKPKEQIKSDIGYSPDWRDTLLMRCWFDYNEYDIPDNIEKILGLT